eukprot:TRINITY_DN51110_c0_g1_i1.p1 TRINITY_DN51110_c0_g1~~TRINITY_DN51110_c0_g1_i1.p1  ORF type:complete len:351 (+),score=85.78 TRINITY_DN51110_c0_g1_i1:160-1212(+)
MVEQHSTESQCMAPVHSKYWAGPEESSVEEVSEAESRSDVIMDKIRTVLAELGLTRVGQSVAFGWIRESLTQEDCARVRKWILLKCNGVNFPKGCSTWQRGCPLLIPGLQASPFWDKHDPRLSWILKLEAEFKTIKDELLSLRESGGFQPYRSPVWCSHSKADDGIGGVSHDAGDWNVFYLELHNVDFEANRERVPRTMELIRDAPGNYKHAFFSALSPGTHITKHHGPTNKKLRVHLPLVVPPGGSQLRCADVVLDVKEGEAFIFDDSHEHEAWNHDPDGTRIVLIIDIWHPDLSQKEVKFLKFVQEQQLRVEKANSAGQDGTFFDIIDKARGINPNQQAIWGSEFNSN